MRSIVDRGSGTHSVGAGISTLKMSEDSVTVVVLGQPVFWASFPPKYMAYNDGNFTWTR